MDKDKVTKLNLPSDKSKKNSSNVPSRKISTGRPRIESRISVEELRAAYKKQLSHSKSEDVNQDTVLFDPLEKCREFLGKPRNETGVVFDSLMEEHLCPWDKNYAECPQRYTSVIKRCNELNLLSRCKVLSSRRATEGELTTLHSQDIVNLVKSTAEETDEDKLEEISSHYDSVYLHPKSSATADLAAGCTIDLVSAIVKGDVHNGMAIVRPPGHHAMQDTICGYCIYNNVALAAKHALDSLELKRILIVDWDVHHGQGTQQMFYDDDRVLYFSIHRFEQGEFWPNLRESNYDHIGINKGKGYNCNVPLNCIGMGNKEYLAIWTQLLLPIAYQFNPELIIISAGYDAAISCPEGEMSLTPSFYCQLTSLLMPLAAGKIAVVLEGGYCLESLSESAALTLRTLLGDKCPNMEEDIKGEVHPSVSESILNCISVLRSKWKCLNYQTTHGHDAPIDRPSRNNSRPKHVPCIKFNGPENLQTKFPTRDCYPILDTEEHRLCLDRLKKLKEETILILPDTLVCYAHDPIMESHYCQTESSHPERPARTREIIKLLKEKGMLKRMNLVKCRSVTSLELMRVHSSEVINLMKSIPSKTEAQLHSIENDYTSVYFNGDTMNAASIAAGSLIEVVHQVVSGAASRGVGIIRPPGHHAEHNEPNGFCFFNNVAVAARYAIDTLGLERIFILDWDIHHGNGIQHAFETDNRVLYISMHLYKNATFFPNSTDANYDKLGEGNGLGYNINIPWQKSGVGDAEYIAAFTQVILPIAYEFAPQLVLVSAGFDAAVNDPVGGCEVSPECYGHMTKLLMGLAAGRIVVVLEGGYNLISTSHSMATCCSALLGDAVPPMKHPLILAQHAVSTINSVLDHAAPYWPSLRPFRVSLPAAEEIKKQRRSGINSNSEIIVADIKKSLSVQDELSAQLSAVTLDH